MQQTAGQWWRTAGDPLTVQLEHVREMATGLLERAGANQVDARFIVDVHLAKALQGDHERGVAMLCAQIRAALAGDLDLAAVVDVTRDHGATAMVEGGPRASPKLVCRDAMELAITKAREHGIGWVSACAAGEVLTPFIEQAVQAGMITMAMAQSIPTVAPHGGTAPMLGNAPMGWGIPAGRNAPVIVDMSLTQTSAKGVVHAAAQGVPVPVGFVLDARGEPTIDARDFVDAAWQQLGKVVARGSLLPIGGSHKSYAQIFVVGLLTSILADADFAWNLGNDASGPRRFGTVFLVLDPKAFGDEARILARVDEYIERLRASPRKAGVERILYPGEGSQALKRARMNGGQLELPAAHYRELAALAQAAN